MATAASLIMNLEARTANFDAGLRKARQNAKDTSNVIKAEFGKGLQTTFSQTNASAAQLFAGLSVGAAVAVAVKLADSYNQLQQRIKIATAATGDFKQVNEALFRIAQQNGASFEATVGVFQRLSLAAGDLGATNKQIETVVDTVQKLGIVSGASTAEMSSGMLQLSQALASGKLQGDELRSIMENMPALARKIAEGLNVPIGALKKMGAEGKLASKQVFDAILQAAPEVEKQFASMPLSMDRAMTKLGNSVTKLVGELDKVLGVTNAISASFNAISKGIDQFTTQIPALAESVKHGLATFPKMLAGIPESPEEALETIRSMERIKKLMQGGSNPKGTSIAKVAPPPAADNSKELKKSENHVHTIIRSLEIQNEKLKNILQGHAELNSTIDEERKLRDEIATIKYPKLRAQAEKLLATQLELNKAILSKEQDEKIKNILDGFKSQTNELQLQITDHRQIIDLMQLQKAIKDEKLPKDKEAKALLEAEIAYNERLKVQQQERNQKLSEFMADLQLKNEFLRLEVDGHKTIAETLQAQISASESIGNLSLEELDTIRKLTEEHAKLEKSLEKQKELMEERDRLVKKIEEDNAKQKDSLDRITEAAKQFGNSIGSAFERAIIDGESLKSVLGGLMKDLERAALRMLVIEPLMRALSNWMTGLFGGTGIPIPAPGGALPGMPHGKIPGFAGGGRPAPGHLALVGEQGPELFVPDTSGNVIPFNRLGGGSNVTVNVFNYSNAKVDQQESVEPDGSRRIDLIVSDMVADNIRRGGSVMRAISERTGVKPRGVLR